MGERSSESYTFCRRRAEMTTTSSPVPRSGTSCAPIRRSPAARRSCRRRPTEINFGTYSGGTWGFEDQAGQNYVVALAGGSATSGSRDVIHLDSTCGASARSAGGTRPASSGARRAFRIPRPCSARSTICTSRSSASTSAAARQRDTTSLLDEAQAGGVIADTPARNIVNFFDPRAVDWWCSTRSVPGRRRARGFSRPTKAASIPARARTICSGRLREGGVRGFPEPPQRRGFNLTRRGYAGIQRYPYIWAATGRAAGSSSRPSCGRPEPGAVRGLHLGAQRRRLRRGRDRGAVHPVDGVRLLQPRVALPRHGASSVTKSPWRYGPRALAAFRRYAQLRYRLMPTSTRPRIRPTPTAFR